MNAFILGIVGGIGSRVARLMLQQGAVVSGLYRHPNQLESIEKLGASGLFGDLPTISAQELATAAAQNDTIVFSAGAGEHDDDSMIYSVDEGGVLKTITAARLTGVSRVLLVSVFPEAWRQRGLGNPSNTTWQPRSEQISRLFIAVVIGSFFVPQACTMTLEPGRKKNRRRMLTARQSFIEEFVPIRCSTLLNARRRCNALPNR